MTDAKDDKKEDPAESERIRKWREERARVAAEEKAERVRAAEELRQKEQDAEKQERLDKAKSFLPGGQPLAEARHRIEERAQLQRRKLQRRAALFIALPTFLVVAYMSWVAVPFYEARSVLIITSAASEDEPSLGGTLGGGGRTLEKAFMASEYLNSRTMMEYLERDLALISRLSSSEIDPLHRLRDIPALGISQINQFDRFVESSIDIQSGLMTLYVRALSPADAQKTSEHILFLLAEHINSLSERLFEERVNQAEVAAAAAQDALIDAQRTLTELQVDSGEADPGKRIETIYAIIQQLEGELEDNRSKIAELQVSGQSDTFQANRLAELMIYQQERIVEFRDQLFLSDDESKPLNAVFLDHEMARLRVRIAEEALTTSLAALSRARTDSELGRSQIQVVVPPNASDISTYPNVLRAMLLTLLTTSAGFVLVQVLRTGRSV